MATTHDKKIESDQSHFGGGGKQSLDSIPSWQLFLSEWGEWVAFSLAVLAAAAGLAGWIADKKLSSLRDRQSQLKIEAANLEAAKAKESAAIAEQKAAEAGLATEREKVARLKLEERLAARTVTEEQAGIIVERLSPFSTCEHGKKVKIGVGAISSEFEKLRYVKELEQLFALAGFDAFDGAPPAYTRGIVHTGLLVRAVQSNCDAKAAVKIADALREAGLSVILMEPWYDELEKKAVANGKTLHHRPEASEDTGRVVVVVGDKP